MFYNDSTKTFKCFNNVFCFIFFNFFKSRIRFKENGSDPSANSGIALGDNDLYEITGRWNLEQLFRVIGIEAGKNHVLRVQYYQSPQNA